ncbi:DNA gyrase [Ruminococcaceae bacterium OttesenSCG-928-I18]|nr:DNA gyrase [Ruminococcaceae bacterium OttesenSCG-928-I18]
MDIPKENRRKSYNAVLPSVPRRKTIILNILQDCGEMTAQEVADELHRRGHTPSNERNLAAPRLTELWDAGKVAVIGKKMCGKTGRSVTVWAMRKE